MNCKESEILLDLQPISYYSMVLWTLVMNVRLFSQRKGNVFVTVIAVVRVTSFAPVPWSLVSAGNETRARWHLHTQWVVLTPTLGNNKLSWESCLQICPTFAPEQDIILLSWRANKYSLCPGETYYLLTSKAVCSTNIPEKGTLERGQWLC